MYKDGACGNHGPGGVAEQSANRGGLAGAAGRGTGAATALADALVGRGGDSGGSGGSGGGGSGGVAAAR